MDLRDDGQCTPLHFAADRGQLEVATLLIQRGAQVNAQDIDGQTPLHYAALCEHEAMCRLLVAHGADAGLQDEGGDSAADVAPKHWTLWS